MLSLHSPSVVPGNTPYVRSDADLAGFLERLRGYLRPFRDELNGRFVTPLALKAELERAGARIVSRNADDRVCRSRPRAS